MANIKTQIGLVKGDKGDKGDVGSKWIQGTIVSGKSTTPTQFNVNALTDDLYLNISEQAVYHCTLGGNPSTWEYDFTLSGSSVTGGDMYKSRYDTNDDGIVDKADAVGNASTTVLENLGEDSTSGNLTYKGQPIKGGSDDVWAGNTAKYNSEQSTIADGTVVVIDDDETTPSYVNPNDFDLTNGILALNSAITQKLSYIGEQIPGDISGSTITFTDTKISGNYLLDVYCSDTDRYIDTQTISGNTMTVVCDDTISSGAIAVCVAIKKGVV